MADRVTRKQLQAVLSRIITLEHRPRQIWDTDPQDGGAVAMIGALYLDYNATYGGWALDEITTDGGGADRVYERCPAREMLAYLRGRLDGLEHGR